MRLNLVRNFQSCCDCPPEGLQIRISTLGGYLCTISINCLATVCDLKASVETATGILACEQRLISRCSELHDADQIAIAIRNTNVTDIILLRRDPEEVGWLKEIQWRHLSEAPESIRNNREVVVAAARQRGRYFANEFQFVSEELRGDRSFALLVLSSAGGDVVQYMSEDLRADREIIACALQHAQPGDALEHASENLRNDRSMILHAVRKHGSLILQAPQHLREDQEIMLSALKSNMHVSVFCPCCDGGIVIPTCLLGNREFLIAAARLGRLEVLGLAAYVAPEIVNDSNFLFTVLFPLLESGSIGSETVCGSRYFRQLNTTNRQLVRQRCKQGLCNMDFFDKDDVANSRSRSLLKAGKRRLMKTRRHSEQPRQRGGRHKAGETSHQQQDMQAYT